MMVLRKKSYTSADVVVVTSQTGTTTLSKTLATLKRKVRTGCSATNKETSTMKNRKETNLMSRFKKQTPTTSSVQISEQNNLPKKNGLDRKSISSSIFRSQEDKSKDTDRHSSQMLSESTTWEGSFDSFTCSALLSLGSILVTDESKGIECSVPNVIEAKGSKGISSNDSFDDISQKLHSSCFSKTDSIGEENAEKVNFETSDDSISDNTCSSSTVSRISETSSQTKRSKSSLQNSTGSNESDAFMDMPAEDSLLDKIFMVHLVEDFYVSDNDVQDEDLYE